MLVRVSVVQHVRVEALVGAVAIKERLELHCPRRVESIPRAVSQAEAALSTPSERREARDDLARSAPRWSKAVESAALEAAGSSTYRAVAGRPVAWPLALRVPSRPEPPGAPRGGAAAELGHCQGGALTMLPRSQSSGM
eukprot:scaffold107179_cov63-Phaeocystis_antarctica.AAC.1